MLHERLRSVATMEQTPCMARRAFNAERRTLNSERRTMAMTAGDEILRCAFE
jgi:hypothetical protein